MNVAAVGHALARARAPLVASAAEAIDSRPELRATFQVALAAVDDALDAARAGDLHRLQRYVPAALRALERAQQAAARPMGARPQGEAR